MCINNCVKTFILVAAASVVLMPFCSVHSYPVYNDNSNNNNYSHDFHNDNKSKIIQTNAEEGEFFEGDIILMPWQKEQFYSEDQLRSDVIKNVVSDPSARWPNKTVYYAFARREFTRRQQKKVRAALVDLMSESCVQFKRRTNQHTYLRLRNNPRRGCASAVGYHNVGRLDLHLGGRSCQTRGTIQHEFLHALGFWHEHTRPDRDSHVTIVWKNISPGKEYNFQKRSVAETLSLNLPYDYGSVMHYRSLAFSKDGKNLTIIPKERSALKRMGQRIRFSKVDIAKLNRLYDCPSKYYRGDDVTHRQSVLPDLAIPVVLDEKTVSELTANVTANSIQEADNSFATEKVFSGKEEKFQKRTAAESAVLNMPYDYGSIMHLRPVAFSKGGERLTIVPHNRSTLKWMGRQKFELSPVDLAKLNILYDDCPSPYYRGDDVVNKTSVTPDQQKFHPPIPEKIVNDLIANLTQEYGNYTTDKLFPDSTEDLSHLINVTVTNSTREGVSPTTQISETVAIG